MRWMDIEKKARTLNIKDPNRYSRSDLVRTIQKTEGNTSCFNTGISICSQTQCCWRKDCIK